MLISQFAARSGLPVDTVRYYVRLGLLRPEESLKGGARPYQVFSDEHLLAARIIRTAQSLGMSLKEIATISHERRTTAMSPKRRAEVLRGQLDRLDQKSAELAAMKTYLAAKIEWVEGGERGAPPDF
jgi:DNA-binding transcriptional MerR regulator